MMQTGLRVLCLANDAQEYWSIEIKNILIIYTQYLDNNITVSVGELCESVVYGKKK